MLFFIFRDLRLFFCHFACLFDTYFFNWSRKIIPANANPKIYANLAHFIVRNEIFIPLWALLKFITASISTASEAVDICTTDPG